MCYTRGAGVNQSSQPMHQTSSSAAAATRSGQLGAKKLHQFEHRNSGTVNSVGLLVQLLASVAVHVRPVVENLSGGAQVRLVAVQVQATLDSVVRRHIARIVREISCIKLLLELRGCDRLLPQMRRQKKSDLQKISVSISVGHCVVTLPLHWTCVDGIKTDVPHQLESLNTSLTQ